VSGDPAVAPAGVTGWGAAPPLTIINAKVVLPDRVLSGGSVSLGGGVIRAIAPGGVAGPALDARGAYLLPGLIDLHNDGLEFEVNPRPETNLPLPLAFANFERQLIAAGVTTEFHALSFIDRPDRQRSLSGAWARAAFIRTQRSEARPVDHHILHRFDVWSPDALGQIFESLAALPVRYLSLNDHTPGQGQYRDLAKHLARLEAYRRQRGTPEVQLSDLLRQVEERRRAAADGWMETVYAQIAARTAALPCVISTHDDDTPEKVDAQAALGATIAEFPVTLEAAQQARRRGMTVVVGAPNVVRGSSHSGNLSAASLIAAGLADVLCADYHASSLRPAAFRLVDDGVLAFPEAVAMLTANPARAVGLTDRGVIAPGKRADLILVRRTGGVPVVEAAWRAGRLVYLYGGHTADLSATHALVEA
jgi:alpha-D-ribose 1-methylphosphonate 5-triphosphate diphosphatase